MTAHLGKTMIFMTNFEAMTTKDGQYEWRVWRRSVAEKKPEF